MTKILRSEEQSLLLIKEALEYCIKVQKMNMPSSCYSKALREPIYFLWEARASSKKNEICKYLSTKSIGIKIGNNKLVYDHVIPFKYVQKMLLALKTPSVEDIRIILEKYVVSCLITKEEDDRLKFHGLNSSMPKDWDGIYQLARYEAVGISVVLNSEMKIMDLIS